MILAEVLVSVTVIKDLFVVFLAVLHTASQLITESENGSSGIGCLTFINLVREEIKFILDLL